MRSRSSEEPPRPLVKRLMPVVHVRQAGSPPLATLLSWMGVALDAHVAGAKSVLSLYVESRADEQGQPQLRAVSGHAILADQAFFR